MLDIQQRTREYCFVACVASMLCDEEPITSALQSLIVRHFPSQLQSGQQKEGVPITQQALKEVIVNLGLAHTVQHVQDKPEIMLAFLRSANSLDTKKILVCSTTPSGHCWRLFSVQPDAVTLMNPWTGQKEPLPDEKFKELGIEFIALDALSFFPHIPPL